MRSRVVPVQIPRIRYAEAAVRAYVNSIKYRKYRKWVLAGVVVYALARKATR